VNAIVRKVPALAALLLNGWTAPAAAQVTDPPLFRRGECTAQLASLGAICGTYPVLEDRAAGGGRRIGLNVVIIPSRNAGSARDAATFLAGGPGQAATDQAPFLVQRYGALLGERDFLFLDQRGTGGSNPLECPLYDRRNPATWLGDFYPPDAVRRCRPQLEERADLRLYTTAIAADDLDEVRAAFGYETLNLLGVSYGTRAALVYMRQYPDRVRSAVLEGVAPPGELIPQNFARDAERALYGVLGQCAADAACSGAFPAARDDARRAFERLQAGPVQVPVLDPLRGTIIRLPLNRDLAAEALRYMLYSAGTAGYVPVVLNRAAAGDYGALAEFALAGRRNIVDSGANGMYLSITCAEDLPWIRPGAGELLAEGSFLQDYRLRQQRDACSLWPRGDVPSGFHEPVRTATPTLILSGEWDPVTPPILGELAARWLPRSRHLVVPDAGHGTGGLEHAGCVHGIVITFISRPAPEALDASCLADVRRGPFALENPAPAPVPVADGELRALAGRYIGVGVPLQAVVTVAGAGLQLELPGGQAMLLVPTGPGRFRVAGAFGLAMTFERRDRGLRLTVFEGGEPQVLLDRR
jgi:pimeloyl-ACP methyl ester carboxylesterase